MDRRHRRRYLATVAGLLAIVAMFGMQSAAVASYHIVQPGESLGTIAWEYGVSSAAIVEANGISDPNLIVTGTELYIPDGDSATGGGDITYVVEWGDSIPTIAAMFGVDHLALAEYNGIEYPWLIYPGDVLVIPIADGGGPAAMPDSSSAWDPIDENVPYYDEWTIRSIIVDTAVAYGWDPYLILSLAYQESWWDQRAISPAGAVGVMQLMPGTAEWVGPALLGRQIDYVNDPWDNIEAGIAFLSHLRALTGSDYLALASYYQGLASVENDGIFASTRDYALGIIERRDLFASGALP